MMIKRKILKQSYQVLEENKKQIPYAMTWGKTKIVQKLFKNYEDQVFCGCLLVCRREREDFWEELGAIRGLWSNPWCVGGDFNMIRFTGERSSGGGLSSTMRRFSEVLEDLELRDIPLQGVPFTWRSGLNN